MSGQKVKEGTIENSRSPLPFETCTMWLVFDSIDEYLVNTLRFNFEGDCHLYEIREVQTTSLSMENNLFVS